MRKFLALLAAAVLVFAFAACGAPEEEQPEEQIDYEIALVTDAGLIMDGGYSEVAWNAISEFGASEGVSHKYYKAAEATEEAYMATIDNAVSRGAKVIVADGDSFSSAVYKAQETYKDVKFVLIDAEPMNEETGKSKIDKNTTIIEFASEQAGFLAGYGAVKDGFTQLGFMGAAKTPSMMDYGYGFLQGADRAAQENGVNVNVNYHYCSKKEDRTAILDRATAWYNAGTEVIFACGTQLELPVIESAELTDKKVIAFETDKSGMSDTVVTSAVKDIDTALETILKQYKDDEFPGGTTVKYNAANEGIWLELENGKLENLSKGVYEEAYDELANNNAAVKRYNSGDIASLGLANVAVSEQ